MSMRPTVPAKKRSTASPVASTRADDVAGVAEDDLAERRQLDRSGTAGAVEHGAADEALEGGDLLADGGLGVAEAEGGLAERALGGDGVEGDEVPELEIADVHDHQAS